MTASTQQLDELAAIAGLRWRMFVNSLRTTRGQLELLSRTLIAFAFAVGGIGGAIGVAVAASMMINAGRPEFVAALFWFVFVFWQAFPIVATAFSDTPDSTDLLRFPLSYRSYFLVRLTYGVFDPASALGILWSLGIVLGTAYTKPVLLPWAALVVLAFLVFNLVFSQMIFAWIERWLARRRTREIMGVLFLLLMLSLQLIGPMIQHFRPRSRPGISRFAEVLFIVQGILPPGLAGDAIAQAMYPRIMSALSSFGLLLAFLLLAGFFLHVRLLAQYRGESFSEVAAASRLPKDRSLRLGWNLPGVSAPVAAVFEKEVHYLLRSGPMLLNLIMPLFVLFIFRFGAMNHGRSSGVFLARAPDMAFPAMAGYVLLMLTNLICNNFGGDGAGMQFLFACPANFRQIILGKNLMQIAVLAAEVVIAWIAVCYFYGPPTFEITVATLAGLVYAAPVTLAAGNLLSIYWPKRLDYSSFRRQRPSQTSALTSLLVQLLTVGIGVAVFFLGRHYGNLRLATLLLLALAALSISFYRLILGRIDHLVRHQQEHLLAELARA